MRLHFHKLRDTEEPIRCDGYVGKIQATKFLYLLKLIRDSSFHISDDLMRTYCAEYNIEPVELPELRTLYLDELEKFYEDCISAKIQNILTVCRDSLYGKKDGLTINRALGDKIQDIYEKHFDSKNVPNRSLLTNDLKTIFVMLEMVPGSEYPQTWIDESCPDPQQLDQKQTNVYPVEMVMSMLRHSDIMFKKVKDLGNQENQNRQDVELITRLLELIVRVTVLPHYASGQAMEELFNSMYAVRKPDAISASMSRIDESAAICIFPNRDYHFPKRPQTTYTDVYKYLKLVNVQEKRFKDEPISEPTIGFNGDNNEPETY